MGERTIEPSLRAYAMLGVVLAQVPVGSEVWDIEAQLTKILNEPDVPEQVRGEFHYNQRRGYIPVLGAVLTGMTGTGELSQMSNLRSHRIGQSIGNRVGDNRAQLTDSEADYLTQVGKRIVVG